MAATVCPHTGGICPSSSASSSASKPGPPCTPEPQHPCAEPHCLAVPAASRGHKNQAGLRAAGAGAERAMTLQTLSRKSRFWAILHEPSVKEPATTQPHGTVWLVVQTREAGSDNPKTPSGTWQGLEQNRWLCTQVVSWSGGEHRSGCTCPHVLAPTAPETASLGPHFSRSLHEAAAL